MPEHRAPARVSSSSLTATGPEREQNDPTLQSRYRLISVDRIRQQPSGNREYGEHCFSSTMPPVCVSA
jgi:hypothetical protein